MANLEEIDKQLKEMGVTKSDDDAPTLKDAAMFGAEFIPGVGEAMAIKRTSDALDEGDYLGAGVEAAAGLMGLVPGAGDLAGKALRTGFKKTRKAYKLFVKGEDGELYPLFVDANKPVKQGEFLEANFPDVAFKGKRKEGSQESFYVPTKGAKRSKGEKAKGTGDSILIPDEATRKKLIESGFITERSKKTKDAPYGRVTAVAARPGWHASQAPVATHLGPQDLKITKKEADKLIEAGVTPEAIKRRGNQFYVKRRAEDQVFAEVDMADDVDYQSMLAKEGRSDINDRVPKGGSYRYSDGQADSDQWVVGGDMKVNRVLSREETRAIQKEMGVTDLPYRDEVEAILDKKFAEGGMVMDDYLVAKTIDQTKKFAEGGMPKQREMFDDGGLMQEGGTVDPESGNEVPVGSTQEEVRDDIPAQLSEGEFVFPADVVRYWGLETLMKMRQEAKAGLQLMDRMGQMGNSEEATVPDDIPFDVNDLDMEDDGVLEYSQGGVVKAQAGTFVQPQGFTGIGGYQPSQFGAYQPQFTPYTPPPMPAGQQMQQQYTPVQQQAVPTISQQAPTFEQMTGTATPAPGGYDSLETYVNDAGMEMQIPFKDGKPIYPIPEGFSKKGDAVKSATTTTTTQTGVQPTAGQARTDDGDDPSAAPEFSTTDVSGIGYDRGKIENEDLLDALNKSMTALAGSLGRAGPTGAIASATGLLGAPKADNAILGGVIDQFRGGDVSFASGRKQGNYGISTELHNLTNFQQQTIANVFKSVSEKMDDLYTKTNEEGEKVAKTQTEVTKSLQVEAQRLGISTTFGDTNVTKRNDTLAREIARKQAEEVEMEAKREATQQEAAKVGKEKRTAAEAAAAEFGVNTAGKSVEAINLEVAQARAKREEEQKALRERMEQAQTAGQRQYDDDDGRSLSASGTTDISTSFGSSVGEGLGMGFLNKGGLVNQMEKSGLTPKK